jgi:lysophospholipase L1-like esterase
MVRSIALALSVVVAQSAPTKVLPLGDSITFGCGDGCGGFGCGDQCAVSRPACQAGWRAGLWRKLSPGSPTSDEWDFVGTQQNGPDDIDRDNEGHPGWKCEGILGIADTWVPLQPDIILLHLGTNNMGIGLQSAQTALGHMTDLLNHTFTALPTVQLYLSTLIGAGDNYGGAKHAEYNAGLVTLAASLRESGFSVKLVDMATESGIGEKCDAENCCGGLIDMVHPNMQGYDLMADVWYKHLVEAKASAVV